MKCKDCAACTKERHYTADPFEHEFDWRCGIQKKIIASSVSWSEASQVKTPEWCPLITKFSNETYNQIKNIISDDDKLREFINSKSNLYTGYTVKSKTGEFEEVIDISTVILILKDIIKEHK